MSDLISRQAAIDTLLGITAMRNTIPLDSAIFNIKKLPSVQPDTTTHDSIPAETGENDGDRTNGDCISRQAAIDDAERRQDG